MGLQRPRQSVPKDVDAVLIALWMNGRTVKGKIYPDANDYIDDFQKNLNWKVKFVAELENIPQSIHKLPPARQAKLQAHSQQNNYQCKSFYSFNQYFSNPLLYSDVREFFGFI